MLSCLGKLSADGILKYFSYFSQKTGLDISDKFSKISNPVFWENISLLSAEFAYSEW